MAKSSGGSSTGMFNFASIMDQFYNWKPGEDDVAGQQLKNTFQGDFIQTVLNNQMAKDLAYTNAEVATGQMKTAAQLELANQTQIMKDEFDYGMQKMGAEYDYQSKFATDEANRELNKMGAAADLQQAQTKLEGEQNRLGIKEQGRQDMNLQTAKNKGAMEQLKLSGLNDQQLQKLKDQGALQQISAQGGIDKWLQSTKGAQALQQIGAQGKQDRSCKP